VELTNYDKLKSGSGTVDKMAGIFTKRIWLPYTKHVDQVEV